MRIKIMLSPPLIFNIEFGRRWLTPPQPPQWLIAFEIWAQVVSAVIVEGCMQILHQKHGWENVQFRISRSGFLSRHQWPSTLRKSRLYKALQTTDISPQFNECMYVCKYVYYILCMYCMSGPLRMYVFFHSFVPAISIAPLQVLYYSEVLPTQHGYCIEVSCRSATGNCKWRTCPRSLRGG